MQCDGVQGLLSPIQTKASETLHSRSSDFPHWTAEVTSWLVLTVSNSSDSLVSFIFFPHPQTPLQNGLCSQDLPHSPFLPAFLWELRLIPSPALKYYKIGSAAAKPFIPRPWAAARAFTRKGVASATISPGTLLGATG